MAVNILTGIKKSFKKNDDIPNDLGEEDQDIMVGPSPTSEEIDDMAIAQNQKELADILTDLQKKNPNAQPYDLINKAMDILSSKKRGFDDFKRSDNIEQNTIEKSTSQLMAERYAQGIPTGAFSKSTAFEKAAIETNPDVFMPAMAQASYDPQKTYLSTGTSTSFDPSQFEIEDTPWGKPSGVLYGSEYWPKGKESEKTDWHSGDVTMETDYSDWDRWTNQNWEEMHYPRGMTYTYKPEARVYKVRSKKDLLKLPEVYWEPDLTDEYYKRIKGMGYIYNEPEEVSKKVFAEIRSDLANGKIDKKTFPHVLNYSRMSKDWDAIDFLDTFARRATVKRMMDGSNRVAPVLDAGQSILLNKDMIADVQPWERPAGSSRLLEKGDVNELEDEDKEDDMDEMDSLIHKLVTESRLNRYKHAMVDSVNENIKKDDNMEQNIIQKSISQLMAERYAQGVPTGVFTKSVSIVDSGDSKDF